MYRSLKVHRVGGLLLMLMLAGCQDEVTFTVYMRDLVDVAADPAHRTEIAAEYTTTILAAPEKCADSLAEIKEDLTRIVVLEETRPLWCDRLGTDTILHVRFRVPLLNATAEDTTIAGGVAFATVQVAAELAADGQANPVILFVDQASLAAFGQAVSRKMLGSNFDPTDLDLNFSIHNDLRADASIVSAGSFLNGTAILPTRDVYKNLSHLKPRDLLEVRPSDWRRRLILGNHHEISAFWWSGAALD